MLEITNSVSIPDNEMEITAIRAQGAGGQNVNKVSSAIHLRFDINASSLPAIYKQRLLNLSDKRITKEGIIILKAQKYRTQEQNREDVLERLLEMIKQVTVVPKMRREAKPTWGSQKRRMDNKTKRSQTKTLRGKVLDE